VLRTVPSRASSDADACDEGWSARRRHRPREVLTRPGAARRGR
jgi:hypothetical protein